jgi:response regulator RpfG family c-di-GMP phosphodiesterase
MTHHLESPAGIEYNGYQIFHAEGGASSLVILAKEAIGGILSDQMIPGANGSTFLEIAGIMKPDTGRIILINHL